MGLTGGSSGRVEQFEPFDAVRPATLEQRDEGLCFFSGCGHDQLAAAGMRHAVAFAELVQQRPAADAQGGFERAWRVVEAGVDHATVVGAGVEAGPRMPLEQAHRAALLRQCAGRGQAADSRANHGHVYPFHVWTPAPW